MQKNFQVVIIVTLQSQSCDSRVQVNEGSILEVFPWLLEMGCYEKVFVVIGAVSHEKMQTGNILIRLSSDFYNSLATHCNIFSFRSSFNRVSSS